MNSIRWRMLLVRLAERVALATTAALFLVAFLMPILIVRGQSLISLLWIGMTAGIIGGSIWALSNRPTRTQAALEADRQLQLSDLLATAIALPLDANISDAPWMQAILATAEQRCATLSPSQLVFARLGVRRWSGIGIASALIIATAIVSSIGIKSQANRVGLSMANAGLSSSFVAPGDLGKSTRVSDDLAFTPMAQQEELGRANELGQLDAEDNANGLVKPQGHSGESTATAETRIGVGVASSHTASSATRPPEANARNSIASSTRATKRVGATGNGQSLSDTMVAADTNSASESTSAPQEQGTAVPPWSTPQWLAVRDQAAKSANDPTTPDAYRDLVRDYFAPSK